MAKQPVFGATTREEHTVEVADSNGTEATRMALVTPESLTMSYLAPGVDTDETEYPTVHLELINGRMTLFVWDSAHEDPVVHLEFDDAGHVIAGEHANNVPGAEAFCADVDTCIDVQGKKLFIVEVAGEHDGQADLPSGITIDRAIANTPDEYDVPVMFIVVMPGNDGVLREIDCGFKTAAEAHEAWPDAEYMPGRGR